MKKYKILLSLALITYASSAVSHAWWYHANTWGVNLGHGGYSSFNTWVSGGNLHTDWSGVYRNPGHYVMAYPSAVDGWHFNNDFYLKVKMDSGYSYAGCYFNPWINGEGWDDNNEFDVWNTALDLWCHANTGNYDSPTDEVMMWNYWKGIPPIGAYVNNRSGYEYWEGNIGWDVRTLRDWGNRFTIDCKSLCQIAGVQNYKYLTSIQAGAEVGQGTAKFRMWGYSSWWRSDN